MKFRTTTGQRQSSHEANTNWLYLDFDHLFLVLLPKAVCKLFQIGHQQRQNPFVQQHHRVLLSVLGKQNDKGWPTRISTLYCKWNGWHWGWKHTRQNPCIMYTLQLIIYSPGDLCNASVEKFLTTMLKTTLHWWHQEKKRKMRYSI